MDHLKVAIAESGLYLKELELNPQGIYFAGKGENRKWINLNKNNQKN